MAATRLIAMHLNKGRTIAKCLKDRTDYAKNPEKTEGGSLVSSYACNADIADKEFAAAKAEYLRITGRRVKGDIIAYQIRQSFKPGEISPEEANSIGYETAMRFTKGHHAFIVATHTDREHIHNHIIFNSTNLDCDRKFRDSWFIALVLQKVSDLVCLEHCLSVIKPKKPSEREKRTEYPKQESNRGKIRKDIDQVLSGNPKSFDDFLQQLSEKGYEIKSGKHRAIRSKDQKRFLRFRSLGDGYTEEEIREAILEKAGPRRKETIPERPFDLLIDIQEKMKQGKGGGYTRWVKVHNLKQLSQTLLFLEEQDVRDLSKLKELSDQKTEKFHELSKILKDTDARLMEIAEQEKAIVTYAKTREIFAAYKNSGYNRKFYEAHREELTRYRAAREVFSSLPDQKAPKMKDLKVEYEEVLSKKRAVYPEYRKAKKEMQDFLIARQNVESFLNVQEEAEKSEAQRKEKKQNTEVR